jgi:hypothetical protein
MHHRKLLACAILLSLTGCEGNVAGTRSVREPVLSRGTLAPGSVLSGTLAVSSSAPGAAGSRGSREVSGQRFTARIGQNGVAFFRDPGGGPAAIEQRVQMQLVAVTDAVSRGEIRTERRTSLDARGRVHTLEITRQGRRPLGFSHTVDGVLHVRITPQWRRRDDGWLLEHAEMVLHGPDGAVLHTLRFALNPGDPDPLLSGLFERFGAPVANLVRPTPLFAQSSTYCNNLETAMFGYLTLAIAAAAAQQYWAVAGAMLGYYNTQNAWYENCY